MLLIACSTGIRSTKPLDEACRRIAETGFTAVDPLCFPQWHVPPDELVRDPDGTIGRVAETLARHGLSCPAINFSPGYNPTRCSEDEHRKNRDAVRQACRLARALGAAVLSLYPGHGDENEPDGDMARLVPRLRQFAGIAAGTGVTLAVETHVNCVTLHPRAALRCIDRCPGVALTYDPSHFVARSIPVEDTVHLLGRAAHVHIRNARKGRFQAPMERGELDMEWMARTIAASGYRGAVAIEYIEDCGAVREGYDIDRQVDALHRVLRGAFEGTR